MAFGLGVDVYAIADDINVSAWSIMISRESVTFWQQHVSRWFRRDSSLRCFSQDHQARRPGRVCERTDIQQPIPSYLGLVDA